MNNYLPFSVLCFSQCLHQYFNKLNSEADDSFKEELNQTLNRLVNM